MKRIQKLNSIFLLFVVLVVAPKVMGDENYNKEGFIAFSKAYGYVKYFHASDESKDLDWDEFLKYGLEEVSKANTNQRVKQELQSLFYPLTPAIRISSVGEEYSEISQEKHNINLKPLFWQHLGFGGKHSIIYRSKVFGRETSVDISNKKFGNIMQSIDVVEMGGKNFRLSAWVKTQTNSEGRLWVRVDRKSGEAGFFDNMANTPIVSSNWKRFEISGAINKDANRVVFGALVGTGNVIMLDDFQLEVEESNGNWRSVEIPNHNFECWVNDSPCGWIVPAQSFSAKENASDFHAGTKAARLGPEYKVLEADKTLFDSNLTLSDVVNEHLNDSLKIYMPLVYWSKGDSDLSKSSSDLEKLLNNISNKKGKYSQKVEQLADFSELWNVIQHFYPYREEIKGKWEGILAKGYDLIINGLEENEFDKFLEETLVLLSDGHARLIKKQPEIMKSIPVLFNEIEGDILVTKSEHSMIKVGDKVKQINNVDVDKVIADSMKFISGSKQSKHSSAIANLRVSSSENSVLLRVDRDKKIFDVSLEYEKFVNMHNHIYSKFQELDEKIYYVDLSRISSEDILDKLEVLSTATAVIFDLRNRPLGNYEFLSHLMKEKDVSKGWLKIPEIEYPNFKKVTWKGYEWKLDSKHPKIQGELVFLANANTFSYPESILGYVEHYKLGMIIGQQTAGANGDIKYVELPSGKKFVFTGARVLKHDGSKFNALGFSPDIGVELKRTTLLSNKDDYIEEALKYVRSKISTSR